MSLLWQRALSVGGVERERDGIIVRGLYRRKVWWWCGEYHNEQTDEQNRTEISKSFTAEAFQSNKDIYTFTLWRQDGFVGTCMVAEGLIVYRLHLAALKGIVMEGPPIQIVHDWKELAFFPRPRYGYGTATIGSRSHPFLVRSIPGPG